MGPTDRLDAVVKTLTSSVSIESPSFLLHCSDDQQMFVLSMFYSHFIRKSVLITRLSRAR